MNRYSIRKHIGCGSVKPGNLTYEKDVIENVVVNKRDVRKFGAEAKIKQITKSLFRCDKCNELINIVTCPSWEDFVLRGRIRVTKQEYWRIKTDRKRGAVRL